MPSRVIPTRSLTGSPWTAQANMRVGDLYRLSDRTHVGLVERLRTSRHNYFDLKKSPRVGRPDQEL